MKQETQIMNFEWDKSEALIWKNPAEETYYLRKRWELRGFDSFLDLGCTTGRHSLFFAEDGYTVTVYQTKNVCLEELSEKVNELGLEMKYVQGTLPSLEFEDQSFDSILAYDSLLELDEMELTQVFTEIHRILKPDGECYITLPSNVINIKELSLGFQIISAKKITTFTENGESEIYHVLLKK